MSIKKSQAILKCFIDLKNSVWFIPGGGRYSGFQVTGMIEGFFLGLKFSIPGFFWVRRFGKYFFGWLDLSRDFLGVLKRIGSALAA